MKPDVYKKKMETDDKTDGQDRAGLAEKLYRLTEAKARKAR